jgi:hypothetical protein
VYEVSSVALNRQLMLLSADYPLAGAEMCMAAAQGVHQ